MKITKELIKNKFIEYNALYFNNELPVCKFSAYDTIDELGLYTHNKIWIAKKPKNISSTAKWTEELFKNTLIHEMIHHYVSTIGNKKTFLSPHGLKFRLKCWELKRKYGINIEIGIAIKRYGELKRKTSPSFLNKIEMLYLSFFNYLLMWIF